MKAVRFEQVSLSAYAWRQVLNIADMLNIQHGTKEHKRIEDMAWTESNKPATLLELQGKMHRRYFSYEIHSDRYWSNMSGMFFMHCSNAEWWKAEGVLKSMEDMASRYAAYPYGECPV